LQKDRSSCISVMSHVTDTAGTKTSHQGAFAARCAVSNSQGVSPEEPRACSHAAVSFSCSELVFPCSKWCSPIREIEYICVLEDVDTGSSIFMRSLVLQQPKYHSDEATPSRKVYRPLIIIWPVSCSIPVVSVRGPGPASWVWGEGLIVSTMHATCTSAVNV
jgi:hypothetical protein